MAPDLAVAQHAATVALNFALAIAAGALASALFATHGASPWAAAQGSRARRAGIAALVTAMLASACGLWLKAAAMAEAPVTEAGAAAWTMLTATHLGLAWSVGIGALVFSAGAVAWSAYAPRRAVPISLGLLGVAVFLYTRSIVSHASADGDFSAAVLVDWLHLVLISLWTGEVCVAGFVVPGSPAGMRTEDRDDCARYVSSLSASATIAVAGIVATGLFSAWHNLGSVRALAGNPYGTILVIKVGLVAVAVVLGGVNRFAVMPSLMAGLRGGKPEAAPAARRFAAILKAEACVLLGVLILAAILSATSPQVAG